MRATANSATPRCVRHPLRFGILRNSLRGAALLRERPAARDWPGFFQSPAAARLRTLREPMRSGEPTKEAGDESARAQKRIRLPPARSATEICDFWRIC